MEQLNSVFVTNKSPQENDHRLFYSRFTRSCRITYAMPSKPVSLSDDKFMPIKIGEGFKLSYLIELLRIIWQIRRLERFHLIHFSSTVLILFGPMLAKIFQLPSIITITGFGRCFSSDNVKFKLLKKFYLLLFFISGHISKRILFQNHGDMAYLGSIFPTLSWKLCYLGSSAHGKIVKKKDFGNTRLRVLHVGRIIPDKGIDDFLKVTKKLHLQSFDFVLVGPEVYGFKTLLNKVIDYHNKGFLNYKGSIPNSMLLKEMENSHIFFFPSYYGEGMARVMLECGLAGMAPIAYDINANKDLISDGCGFKVAQGDTEKVVDLLSMLDKNRDILEENARTYQEHIIKNFSLTGFCKRMDHIVAQVKKEILG